MTRGMWRVAPLFMICVALICLCPLPELLGQEEKPRPDDTMVTMDFQDVDLTVLIKFISELTGRNFILDEKVKGKKVTVISPTKITKEEAYRVFESILEIKGLSTVPAGKVIKIVPAKEAVEKNLRTLFGREKTPISDTLVTRLIPLEYVAAEEMVKVLKPLMSRESQIDSYAATNTLIITETGSNIDRLIRILEQLDIKADEMMIEVIPLQYASAVILAKQIQELLQASAPSGGATPSSRRATRTRASAATPASPAKTGSTQTEFTGKIIPDDRTNSVIILTTETQLRDIRELIQKLDYDTPRAYGNIQVYYLEYAKAEDTAKVLTELVSGVRSPSSSSGNGGGQASISPAVARTLASFEGDVSITADGPTNSILIVASPRDYQTLRNVVEKLDIRRKQVYVEGVVMEVNPSFSRDLGFEYRGSVPLQSGDTVDQFLIGGTNFQQGTDQLEQSLTGLAPTTTGAAGTTSLFPLVMGDRSGLNVGAVFDRIKIPTPDGKSISIPANTFLLHALQSSTKANILSTPHLIAIDNEEAEIVVGKNVPFVTSTSQSTVSTMTQIQRQNVGLTLRFTPQITEGDYVQLKLFQEISALITSPIGQDVNRVGPTTSTRTASNTVLVRDGQTIIVGGLVDDRVEKVKSGVPWLQDIPGLGWLFRYEKENVEKSNLLIFLTPTIVREDQDVQRLYEEKKREMIQYRQRHEVSDKYMDTDGFPKKRDEAGTGDTGTGVKPSVETVPQTLEQGFRLEQLEGAAKDSGYDVTVEGADRIDTPEPVHDQDATTR